MATTLIIPGIFLILGAGALACLPMANSSRTLRIPVSTSLTVFILTVPLALRLFTDGAYSLYGRTLLIDHLSMYHILLVNMVFLITAIYASGYFKHRIQAGTIGTAYIKRYCMLWQAFQAMLLLVLLSNHIGVMWVALEATTLVSAFLIISEADPLSIEAMWKYLLICSVGIVFAFMGTILTVAAAKSLQGKDSLFLFSQLKLHADQIDPQLMLFAFIFIVVGFGTKAGVSPMHTWLPDAHSQAPTPVSAVFSGVMLNCALFCIMRYLPITEAALGGDGQAHSILLLFGFLSLLFAAIFIPIQNDIKRFLAYCSVEHMGIIVVGLGLGGIGTFAALLHTANHSLAKVLSFFSAGHISDHYGTRDMRLIRAAAERVPLWGKAFFLSILVLIGVAPFSVFMSEFLIIKEAFFQGRYVVVGLFLFCVLAVFFGALKHVLNLSFGSADSTHTLTEKPRLIDILIVLGLIAVLLLLGIWIPSPFAAFLKTAAGVVEKGTGL
jgi:hydrogenase-4 component F